MNYFTLFGIFFILWWIVFFIVLPLNITTHMDKGIDVEGIHTWKRTDQSEFTI